MKKIDINRQTKLLATRKNRKEINYYIVTPENEKLYAFTRPYNRKAWDMCKAGARVNEFVKTRTKDVNIMLLVKYTKYILPYLCEEYGLGAA